LKSSSVKPSKLYWLPVLFLLSGCSSISKANQTNAFKPCHDDLPRLEARSKELAAIVQADQDDRKDWEHKSSDEMLEVAKRDVPRRQQIGEIFGEGCFSKASDYSAAALVYQHGDIPDHFFQTFIWSKRAVELGDLTQKRTMALGIDRYLVNIGQKQLFGSQAFLADFKPETCWCLQQIETSYPDNLRKDLAGKSLSEAFDWLKELNAGKTCPIRECATHLKPSPKGTVPGFW
jgi:hypothetical protein